MARQDLTGCRFGILTVVERAQKEGSRRTFWKCRCDCGNEKIFRSDHLRADKTKSCGCLHTKKLSGKVFGRLTVLNEHRTHRRKTYTVKQWKCTCNCGKSVWVNSQDLITKHTQSCGCLQKETNRSRRLEFGLASKRKCYGNYKKAAKNDLRKFELTFQEFINITAKSCMYCGNPPSNVLKSNGYNGHFVYSGIDRANSNIGYILSNCVPCCKICNIAKHNMTQEAFAGWLRQANLHLNGLDYQKKGYDPCIVVAEIGANHMGDYDIALQMIKTAKLCNADYVKFQKRSPKLCVPKHIQLQPHPNPRNAFGDTYIKHRKKLELSMVQHKKLKAHCDEIQIGYACSVWDTVSAKNIIALKPDYIKIPSAMNNNFTLIGYVFKKFTKDVHISLGMATQGEIDSLIKFIRPYLDRTVFYWTTSGYPVDFEELFLMEIPKLRERGFRVGFSGHHRGLAVDMAAYALGATHIERHFTLDRCWKGTDHAASLEPIGLNKLCRDLKAAYKSFGFKHQITEDEKDNRKKLRT